MNILLINTIDSRGGAAIVAWNLRKKLEKMGHKTSMFVRWKYSKDRNVHIIPKRIGQDFLINFFANDLKYTKSDWIMSTKEFKECDVVHCHNLHSNFFNLSTLEKMSKIKPVVWTQHDLWSITGGCTTSNDCNTKKPFRKFFWFYDNSSNLLKAKKRLYGRININVVANSTWMYEKLKKSILNKQSISLIKNGIDTDIFKNRVKNKLKLPLDKKIVMHISKGGQDNELKGSYYLKRLMDRYKDRDVFFVCIGNEKDFSLKSKNRLYIPYVKDAKILSKYLSAAEIFFYPSLADSFGLVVAEAICSKTPVLSFDVDALSELVEHKENGYLAKYKSYQDLLKGFDYLLSNDLKKTMDVNKFRHDYSLRKMANEYVNLYRKILRD